MAVFRACLGCEIIDFRLMSRGYGSPIFRKRSQVYIDRNQEFLTPMIVPVLVMFLLGLTAYGQHSIEKIRFKFENPKQHTSTRQ